MVPDAIRDTCKYCAPLFFINALAITGLADLPKADAFNGTVTFILFEERTYAITARHVISFLREKAREAHGDGWLFSTLLGGSGSSVIDYRLPSLGDTFRQPSAVYPERAPDIALTRIWDSFPVQIGKAAFQFARDSNVSAPVAVAVGYPTDAKFDVFDEKGRRVGMKCVHAVAERASHVRFFSELRELPEVSGLNGMSGGPIFLPYQEEEIVLAGIVVEGPPFLFDAESDGTYDTQEGLTKGPRVGFAMQPISADSLRTWIAELGQ